MKINLEVLFKELGLPVGLVLLFSAVLGLIGLSLDTILLIVGTLFGVFALIAFVIDVLKWAGVVTDGTSGKWSAIMNLFVVIAVTVIYKLYPAFDFVGADAQIADFVRVATIVFAYVIQIVGTKGVHLSITRGLSLQAFSYSQRPPKF